MKSAARTNNIPAVEVTNLEDDQIPAALLQVSSSETSEIDSEDPEIVNKVKHELFEWIINADFS